MVVWVVQALLLGEQAGPNDGEFANASAAQATDAVVSVLLNVFQVKGRLLGSGTSWHACCHDKNSLAARVGFGGMCITVFKVL